MKHFKSDLLTVKHGFFSRIGGVSSGLYEGLNFSYKGSNGCKKDDLENVMQNEKLVLNQFDGFEKIIRPNQVHSGNALIVDDNIVLADGDALITYKKNILIGIITADCVPILLQAKKSVAAIHAGWRGMIKECIIENTLKKLAGDFPVKAVVGPCIRHYEIKEDVAKLVPESFLKKYNNDFLFDIAGLAKFILKKNGVTEIDDVNLDTLFNEKLFFSCRRAYIKNEPNFGCQISVIGMI